MAEFIDVRYGDGYDYPVTVTDDKGEQASIGRFFYNTRLGEWVLRIQHEDINNL